MVINVWTKKKVIKLYQTKHYELYQPQIILENQDLKQLYQIEDITGIQIIGDNNLQINEFDCQNLQSLILLQICNVELRNITNIFMLKNLKILSLAQNNLSNLEEVKLLNSLISLNISHNNLFFLPDLSKLQLQFFQAQENPLIYKSLLSDSQFLVGRQKNFQDQIILQMKDLPLISENLRMLSLYAVKFFKEHILEVSQLLSDQ